MNLSNNEIAYSPSHPAEFNANFLCNYRVISEITNP